MAVRGAGRGEEVEIIVGVGGVCGSAGCRGCGYAVEG